MRASLQPILALVLSVCAFALPRAAFADDNDLTLERLIGRPSAPGQTPTVTPALQSAYAGLLSELGVVLAPRALQPADTLGWSGFAASVETTLTQVNNSADYWQKGAANLTTPFLTTIGAGVRKGIFLGFPSIEIAVGGKKIIGSNMFGLELSAKLALHEGYHRWAIPSFALRVAVARLFGAPQVSMTVLDTGVLVSKRFPVRGTVTIDPYIGAGVIVTFVQSQVVDTTPDVDAFRQGTSAPDVNSNITLPDPGALPRVRFNAGLRIKASIFQVTAEAGYVLCNATGHACAEGGDTEVVDRSGGQAQVSLSAGLVY